MKSFHITMKILEYYFFFIFPHKKFVISSWKNGQTIKWFSLGQIKILDNKVKSWSPATYFKSGKCHAEVH